MSSKFLGIFVNPVDVQSEGICQVFDNLESVGAGAIALTPKVATPAEWGRGIRFPDLHVDGHDRVLERPVWGKREIKLEFFDAYTRDLGLYGKSTYKPQRKSSPPGVDHEVPSRMIEEAKSRGMQAYLQVQPLLLPGLLDEDRPVYVDDSSPQPPRLADTACPNNPAAESYALALVKDVMESYSEADGLFMDWTEFGAYSLEDHFSCFCPHCEEKARSWGIDWDTAKNDTMVLWEKLHALTPADMERSLRLLHSPANFLTFLMRFPGWLALWRFKAQSVIEFYQKVRNLLDREGLGKVKLSARGWPPPWNLSTGMDYRGLAEVCDAVTPKLFTFDYCAIPRWYGQTLLAWNPELLESTVLDFFVEWLNLPDDIECRSFPDYRIPAPGELHPAKLDTYQERTEEIVEQVQGRVQCYPFAHAYLPEQQWERMVALLRDSRADGMWVQMYGYLSDRKLELLRQMWR